MKRRSETVLRFLVAFAVLAAAGAGCVRGGRKHLVRSTGAVARMEAALVKGPGGRLPAADGGEPGASPSASPAAPGTKTPRCLLDYSDRSGDLETEITALESKFVSKPPTGFWGNVDLSKISIAQSQFLSRHGNSTLPASLKSLDCKDARCLLKSIYAKAGRGEEDAASHYLFFLRTGYGLGATRNTPDANPVASLADQDYLFTHDELRAFWLLSHGLGKEFLNLPSLQAIYRLPRTYFLPSYGNSTCGLATGTASQGHITLMDSCLALSDPIDSGRDFFFEGTLHEISHRLDDVLTSTPGGYSESQEWLKVSGWRHFETKTLSSGGIVTSYSHHWEPGWRQVTTGSTSATGVISAAGTWVQAPELAVFVRDYAKTDPGEDFADSAAYFRFQGELTQTKIPAKAGVLSKKVFGGKVFTSEMLAKAYLEQMIDRVSTELDAVFAQCSGGSETKPVPWPAAATAGASPLTIELDIADLVSQEVKTCIETRVAGSIAVAAATIRAQEIEGCRVIDAAERLLFASTAQGIAPKVRLAAQNYEQFAAELKLRLAIRETFKRDLDPREIFIRCAGGGADQECFDASLAKLSDDAIARTEGASAHPGLALEERQRFAQAHAYAATQAEVEELFGVMFGNLFDRIEKSAEERWSSCRSAGPVPESKEPLVEPYSGGAGVVPPEILFCINSAAEADVAFARDEYLNRLGFKISDDDTAAFTLRFLLRPYLAVLEQRQKQEFEVDSDTLASLEAVCVDREVSKLKIDAGSIGKDEAKCRAKSRYQMPDVIRSAARDQKLNDRQIDNVVERYREDWSIRACEKYLGKSP